ncbi:MAG: DNA gyrase subunit A [Actinobacteria bacterium]|nr:MAG: DNA gyrase subunit A [Actinomycetota bacterium]
MAEVAGGKVLPREIEDEMRESFIDYAMSVIVARALPDVRDGLKPVHRRILYAMQDMGMTPGRPFKKCARIVGEVLGKYHPHGDTAVYDTMVRMAQDFAQRYELIEGYGNFGSVDGDSPAAMRYTEARLARLSMELLRDLDKDTVDFGPNFDETLQEPLVLPSRYPNLLVNGSAGIAVGMATNIPPHNLAETIDATVRLIDDPELTSAQLMRTVKGPDFPTGGIIMGKAGITQAYETGRGSLVVRGKAHIEEAESTGRNRIIITELPYQVNKARLVKNIAELVQAKKLTEISDLRDESDRKGMRVVVELKRDAIPQVALNKLYKHTQLQSGFGIIMLALVDGMPRTLPLKDMLAHYIAHQRVVVIRRTKFELDKAEARAHILEGLLIALDNIDEVIATIKASADVETARNALMGKFSLSEKQAQAILDMRLQRLTALEHDKIEQEHAELVARIAELKAILADERKVYAIVKEEMLEIKKRHADARRTMISASAEEIEVEDLIAEEDMVVTITHHGYVKRLPVTTYRQQRRGGRGIAGLNLKEGDFVEHLFISSTHDYVLFFSNKGKVYRVKVYELPLGSRHSRGQAIVNVLPFEQGEKIASVLGTRSFSEDTYLMLATKLGIVKKTKANAYDSSRRDGIIALTLREDDELIGVKQTSGDDDVLLVSKGGQSIRFNEKDIRAMGRTAMGVKGIRLRKGDEVLGMEIALPDADLFVVTEGGYGKRTPLDQYPRQRRGGMGVRTIRTVEAKGALIGVKIVRDNHELLLISQEGIVIRTPAKDISQMSRNTQGVRVMNVKNDDRVSALARLVVGKKTGKAATPEEEIEQELEEEGTTQAST